MPGKDSFQIAKNVNWLDCVCIIHGLHVWLETGVDFEYDYQLISTLFLRKK